MTFVTPVILCGGSGTRLWPLSRGGFPKQFLCLTGDNSLFQQTAERMQGLGGSKVQATAPLIVCNTAPALTLAALAACEGGNDPVSN